MIDSSLITKIMSMEGKDHKIEKIGEHTYHVNEQGATLLKYPKHEKTKLFSLTQAANFIQNLILKAGGGGEVPDGQILVNVLNETEVEIIDSAYNDDMTRDVYATLDSTEIFKDFESGKKFSQEEFIVELLTKFERDEATLEILELVSSVKNEGQTDFKDSGFSQTVNVKAGVALASTKSVKNLFMLKTFKTFPEVEQPVIPYILRLYNGPSGAPLFALHSADGGQWKVAATKEIREFMTNQLKIKLAEKANSVVVL